MRNLASSTSSRRNTPLKILVEITRRKLKADKPLSMYFALMFNHRVSVFDNEGKLYSYRQAGP